MSPSTSRIDVIRATTARLATERPLDADRLRTASRLLLQGGWEAHEPIILFPKGVTATATTCTCPEGRHILCLHQLAAQIAGALPDALLDAVRAERAADAAARPVEVPDAVPDEREAEAAADECAVSQTERPTQPATWQSLGRMGGVTLRRWLGDAPPNWAA